MALLQLYHFHSFEHWRPLIIVESVVPVGAGGKLVGCYYELFVFELLWLERFVLVGANSGTNALAYPLQSGIVSLREGEVHLELLRCQYLYFAVTLALFLNCEVLVQEVELLTAEDGLQVLDHVGFARVRCSVEPNKVLLGVLPFEEYAVDSLEAFNVTCSLDYLYTVDAIVKEIGLVQIDLHAFFECALLFLCLF